MLQEDFWDLRRWLEAGVRLGFVKLFEEEGAWKDGFGEVLGEGHLLSMLSLRNFDVVTGCCSVPSAAVMETAWANGELNAVFEHALSNPIVPKRTLAAACQEVEVDSPDGWLESLRLPKIQVSDAGPYLTAGLVGFPESANSGRSLGRWGVRRLQFLGRNQFALRVDSEDILEQMREASDSGSELPVAVSLGNHPLILFASQFSRRWFHCDKLALAGGVAGCPVPMVDCLSIPLSVPAFSEVVLEGGILPGQLAWEGPVRELSGVAGKACLRAILQVHRITHRKRPILQVIVPGSHEQRCLSALPREVLLAEVLRQNSIAPVSVCFPHAACTRFSAVIALARGCFAGSPAFLFESIFRCFPDLKKVVLVDDDILASSLEQVEWALATRFQAGRDLVTYLGGSASGLDPSAVSGASHVQLGFDAREK